MAVDIEPLLSKLSELAPRFGRARVDLEAIVSRGRADAGAMESAEGLSLARQRLAILLQMRFVSTLLLLVWPGGGLALADDWEPDGLEAAVVQVGADGGVVARPISDEVRQLLKSEKRADLVRAAELLESCIAARPRDWHCWRALAWVFPRSAPGDPEALARARKAYDRYVELAPKQGSGFQHPWVDHPTPPAFKRSLLQF
jgi:hypothetical protein